MNGRLFLTVLKNSPCLRGRLERVLLTDLISTGVLAAYSLHKSAVFSRILYAVAVQTDDW